MLRFRTTALIGILSFWALAAQASGQTVTFRDGSGAASTFAEGGRAIVQVEDSAANVLGAPDTVQARLTSTRGGDEELLTLTETGAATGVFRGEIQLAPANGSAQPGVLETAVDPNPPFERDTIRAEYGPASATATMVGSKIFFLDDYGRLASQVIAGGTVQVRLIAPLANTNPDLPESVTATLTTGNGDQEYVYLTETGFGTGIFEGARQSVVRSASPHDGFIDIDPVGQTVTAEYNDTDFPTTSRVSAPSIGSRVELVDAAGRPAEFFLESSRVYVELISRPGTPASQVKLTCDLAGDVEILTLQDTGSGTPYRASIPMRRGPAIPNNGILETTEADSPARFDTVRATEYPVSATTDAVPTAGSLTSFRDEYGNEVSRYAAGSTVVVRVEDHNYNDPGAFDSVQAVVQSLLTGDAETLTLQELSRDSGLFEGRIASQAAPAAPSDGRLQAQPGERIQAMHVDAFPQLASGALAAIDALKVQFIDELGRPTMELLPGGAVRVRVTSPGDNANPSQIETLPVQLASRYAADQETLQLTETGPDTGVFEGTLPSRVPSLTPPDYLPYGQPGNGSLDLSNSGPPAFGPEVVTASVGPYTAEARTVSAQVMFIDDFGRPTTSIPFGGQVRVRVIDYTRNDPQFPDTISIQITALADYEFMNLQETGYDTGVFEGTIQMATNRTFYDGRLATAAGDTVTAYHGSYFNGEQITAQARITGGQVLFVDDAGQPASVYLEGTRARVRVTDQGANRHPFQADTVTVSLSTDLSGDAESLTLTETGNQTGIFEGTILLRHGPVLPNSGSIEPGEDNGPPHRFDTVRVSYTTSYNNEASASAVGVQNFRVWFIDADGNVTDHYAQASRAYVRLENHRDGDPGAFDRQTVQVQSSTGDVETLELLETGRSTGIFEGLMPIDGGTPAGDSRLQAAPGSEITAVAAGYNAEPARARIDALSIEFIDASGRSTAELLPGGPVRVRVTSSGDNANPSQIETLPVQLASRYAADQETLQLTETGTATGVFEGTIPSRVPSLTPPDYLPYGQPGNGSLDLNNSGPPAFGAEVVTAAVGPYTAEAHTVSARILFIDDFGRPVTSFPFGSQVRVRVIDYTRNDPQFPDMISIQIASGGDYEFMNLQETGFDTGVFEGAVQTVASSSFYDGRLGTGAGGTVTAYHGAYFNGEQITAQARITGGQVLFVDDAGQPASVYLEGTRARVRVIDQAANRNAFQADTVTVNLSTDLSGDAESLTLTETGNQTGIFEGTILLRHGPVLPNSGSIEPGEDNGTPHQFDTVRASYTTSYNNEVAASAVGVQSFRIWFIDADGNVTDHYAQASLLRVRLEDHRDGDPGAFDRQTVQVQSSMGDQESLSLLETGRSTGIFEGSMPIDGGTPAGDGRLQAAPGSEITAVAAGYNAEPARARIDALSIEFIDDAGRSTAELLPGGPVRVRVTSSGDNANPSQIETLPVQLASRYAADQESLQLTETGPATGVFEGAIPSRVPSLTPPDYFPYGQPGNGRLDLSNSGPPQFGPEVVTASVGPFSAEARTVPARVMFIDAFGRPATSFPFGSKVRVRVIDYTRNDPQFLDMISIQIASGGDYEFMNLQETGFDTGVFEGGIQTVSNLSYYDGQLATGAGDTVTAYHGTYFNGEQVTAQARITGGQVLFVDAAGQPASVVLEGTQTRVRVIDQGANHQPFQADTVTVSLSTDLSGDAESLTLTETGNQTGIFEGTIQLRQGPALPNSGSIEPGEDAGPPHEFDTVRVSYAGSFNGEVSTSAVGVLNFRLWFIDAYGNVTDHYAQASPLYVRLEDHRDGDPGAIDHKTVQLQSSSGDVEVLEVSETGTSTGIFEGSMPLDGGAPAGDGRLQAAPGSEITVLAPGYNAEPARARIDALAVEFIDDAGRATTELLPGGPVRVRVTSVGDNADPSGVESIPVQLGSRHAADQETLQLTETGPGTGVFEGAMPSRVPSLTPPDYLPYGQPGNGSLDLSNSGQPAFGPEVVTASVGPYSAEARTVSARMAFIDADGHPTATFPFGSPVRVRVIDYTRNDPALQDLVSIQIASDGDYESMDLEETGLDTGVFEGSIPTVADLAYYDGRLATGPGGTVTAYHGAYFNGEQITAQARIVEPGGSPRAIDDTAETLVGHPVVISVLANDTDPDGDPLSVTAVTQGTNGAVTINSDGTVTYTPNPGATAGSDSFTYEVSDPSGGHATGHVAVTVKRENHPPVARDDSATVSGNEVTLVSSVTIPVLANDTDPDGDVLTLDSVIIPPPHGTATANADGTITYTPGHGFTGIDEFAYQIHDTGGAVTGARVTVTVTPVNHPPVAEPDSAHINQGGSATIDVLANDSDPDGDPITIIATDGVINPDHTVTFTPRPTVIGFYPFSYTISDGRGGTASGSVTLFVNALPVANADAATVAEDGSVDVAVLANDTDLNSGDTLTVTTVTQGAHGTVAINPNKTLKYTPAANYNGPDSFTYTISDGKNGTATGAVTVTVTSVDDVPVANADSATAGEDGSVDVAVLGNDTDADGDTLTVTAVTQGAHGAVAVNPDKTLKYTPAADYNGPDTFTYTVSDGNGGTATATVSVTVTSVNDLPVANADSATAVEDGTVTIAVLANDTDVDGDALAVASVTQGTNGAVSINPDKTVKYTPAANFHGSDSFTYTISDGKNGTATGTVTVTVTSVNDAPVANADAATVGEDGSVALAVLANDTDADGDALTVASVTQGAHGAVAIQPGQTVKYTPAADYNGPDSFTYTVSDGNGGTASATVSINVSSVNDGPIANPDAVSVAEDGTVSIGVLANDNDPEDDPLTVTAVTQGAHGTVAVNPDKTVRYTPAANYNGPDVFAYTISDGNGGAASGAVTVNVTPVNDPPVAVNDAATVVAGSAVTVPVLANDADLDGPGLSVVSVTQGAHGTVAVNADQTVTYTAGLYLGADSFTYTVSDGAGGTATATVSVNVTAPARVAAGIQARYDFNEGSGNTINDTSGVGAPLNLTIGKPSATAWVAGGFTVQSNASIESIGDATKIISSAQSSNAVTVEAWVRPSSLSLNNGRIAMISKNPAQRNLVFAQSGSLYEAQVRTSSGTPSLQTPEGSASLDLVHLVYARSSSGQAAWYLNGIQVSTQTVGGTFANWGSDQKLIFSENWQGTYFLLAVYGRELTAGEVQQNYLAGVNAN
jgi:hypothetical protein